MRENEYLSIDIEATGLDLGRDQIVQIAMVTSDGKTYSTYVRPTVPISPDAEAIHGLSILELRDAPSFSEVAPKINKILKAYKNIIMFNATFDFSILSRQLKECNYELSLSDKNLIDPYAIHKKLNRCNLESLYSFYTGGIMEGAHDAKVDAIATLQIFQKMQEKYQELNVPETAQVIGFGEMFILGDWFTFQEGLGTYVFNKGKFKGQVIDELMRHNERELLSYLTWILSLTSITIDERNFIEQYTKYTN
jgi:DNA polymerase-3 subunit epsilon